MSVGDGGAGTPTPLPAAGSVKKQMHLSDPHYGPGRRRRPFQREIDTPCEASEDTRRKAGPSDVGRAASTSREVCGGVRILGSNPHWGLPPPQGPSQQCLRGPLWPNRRHG